MPTTAGRIIITKECPRSCSYCCNEAEGSLDHALTIRRVEQMARHEFISISGGEPMLDTRRTRRIIWQIRRDQPWAKIYMNTALLRNREGEFDTMVADLDGLTYTVHEAAGHGDALMLEQVHEIAMLHPEKSMRLTTFPGIEASVQERIDKLDHSVWARYKTDRPETPEELTRGLNVDFGEIFYILDETLPEFSF